MYTEELMPGKPPSSGGPRNFKKFTVQIMGDTQSGPRSVSASHLSTVQAHRGGSPKPKKRFSVKKSASKEMYQHTSFPAGYNPHMFTITAYLPYDGGKRLKVYMNINECTKEKYRQMYIYVNKQ